MPTRESLEAWARAMEKMSYYAVLRLPENASQEAIKRAFHAFSLQCHPDRFIGADPAMAQAAAQVFKRGAEAYNVLGRPALRKHYDEALSRGQVRIDPDSVHLRPAATPSRPLEMLVSSPRAKGFAKKAERFISIGQWEQARIELLNATMEEPSNAELKGRLEMVEKELYGNGEF